MTTYQWLLILTLGAVICFIAIVVQAYRIGKRVGHDLAPFLHDDDAEDEA